MIGVKVVLAMDGERLYREVECVPLPLKGINDSDAEVDINVQGGRVARPASQRENSRRSWKYASISSG